MISIPFRQAYRPGRRFKIPATLYDQALKYTSTPSCATKLYVLAHFSVLAPFEFSVAIEP